MGWLYMPRCSMGGHASAKAYLDAQFTYERLRDDGSSHGLKVLASACPGNRVYYAATQAISNGKPSKVFAIVCLVRWNPRDKEGYIFGSKDMEESMGPCEAECPAAILDLLTPTDAEYAVAWRERCRAAINARARHPRLRNGWTLVFEEPIPFADGAAYDRMEVVIELGRPKAVRFRPVGGRGLYRIGNLDRRRYEIELTA